MQRKILCTQFVNFVFLLYIEFFRLGLPKQLIKMHDMSSNTQASNGWFL